MFPIAVVFLSPNVYAQLEKISFSENWVQSAEAHLLPTCEAVSALGTPYV